VAVLSLFVARSVVV